jgi:Zeta toxin
MTATLSEAGLQRIFNDDIVPTEFGSLSKGSHPTVVFVGGPPGSGVHCLTAAVEQNIRHISGTAPAVINPAFLEPYHPNFVPPTPSGRGVAPDVQSAGRRWAHLAVETVLQAGAHAVIELPMGQPQVVAEAAARFRDAGYYVGMSLLSVPRAVSQLGTFAEFHQQLTHTHGGRLVSRADHDSAYDGLLALAELVDRDRLVDQAQVHGRSGLVAANYLTADGTWQWPDLSIAQAVSIERCRAWHPQERLQFTDLAQRLSRALGGRWHQEMQAIATAAAPQQPLRQAFPDIRSGFGHQAAVPLRKQQSAPPQPVSARHRR